MPPSDLSLTNCPPAFRPFLIVWSQVVPSIQALPPEHQHDLARGQRFGFSSGRTLEQRKSILTPTWDVALRQAREPERKQEQRQKQRLTPTPVQGLATVHKL